ncbi:MAG: complex I subunit 5 family protein [Candidatus Kariarchaeaceae archaeon]|jgi:multicomponent Na+:H+ antiporter subunit D
MGIFLASSSAIFLKKSSKLLSGILYVPILLIELVIMVLIYDDFEKYNKIAENIEISAVSLIIAIFAQSLLILIGLFSIFYVKEKEQSAYFALYFSMNLGILLVFSVSHLFLLFISWELMVLTGYLLVLFPKTEESLEAGFKYLVISTVGSLNILLGMALISGISRDLSYANIASNDTLTDGFIGKLGFTFLILGFGVTAGMLFLNQWLPDAHPAAPAPVSAVLSGIMVNAGIYGILQAFNFMTGSANYITIAQIVVIVGIITMTEANLMIIVQLIREDSKDIKRILAYSTIVHLSYLLVIIPVLTNDGIVVLLMHIFTHGIAKTQLFLITGYLLMLTGSRDLRILKGIGQKEKFMGILVFISLMSLGGLPGTGGFVSKLLILVVFYKNNADFGIFDSTTNQLFTGILIVNGFIAFIGYLWLMKYLLFDKPDENVELNSIPNNTSIVIKGIFLILSLSLIFIGFFPDELISRIYTILP